CIHTLFLRIGHEHYTIDTFQDQLAGGFVKNLSRNGVKMKTCLETANCSQLERHEIKEKRAIGFRGQTDELPLCLGGRRIVDVLQVGRLTTQSGAVIDNLAV